MSLEKVLVFGTERYLKDNILIHNISYNLYLTIIFLTTFFFCILKVMIMFTDVDFFNVMDIFLWKDN